MKKAGRKAVTISQTAMKTHRESCFPNLTDIQILREIIQLQIRMRKNTEKTMAPLIILMNMRRGEAAGLSL